MAATWTAERIALLTELWPDKTVPLRLIVDRFPGISRNSIVGKAYRLRLQQRRTIRNPQLAAMAPVKRRAFDAPPVQRGPREPTRIVVPVIDDAIPPAQRRSLLQLTPFTCRWPVGEPGEAGFFFCGGLPAVDCPYCPAHQARAHRPYTQKPRLPRLAGAPFAHA